MDNWPAWKELESRGLGALYPLIPPIPCKLAAAWMQTHHGQKRRCEHPPYRPEQFPQPSNVPPVLHFHGFLTLPGPQKAAEASSKCLLHCKSSVLPWMAACPCALCFSQRVLWACDQPGAAARTLLIVCTTCLPRLHLLAGAKCLRSPHTLSAGQKH